jgi:hypothetical protein
MNSLIVNFLIITIIGIILYKTKQEEFSSIQNKININTCQNINNHSFPNNIYNINKLNYDDNDKNNEKELYFNLSSPDTYKPPYAQCVDNSSDINNPHKFPKNGKYSDKQKNDNSYMFNIPDKDIRTNTKLLSTSDIFYNLRKNCPNTDPNFF